MSSSSICTITSSFPLFIFTSISSILGYLYIIFSFSYLPSLREHPASIMVGMSSYGLAYSCLYMLSVIFPTKIICTDIAPLVDFFLAGQELYLLVFALDLTLSLKNPFSVDKERMLKYHILAAFVSFIFGAIAYIDEDTSLFGFCWMNQQIINNEMVAFALPHTKRASTGIFFAIEIIIVYVFSLTAMLRCWSTLRKGLPDTFQTRHRILRHLKYYVGVFFLYWTFIFLLFGLYSALSFVNSSKCLLYHFLVVSLLSRGMVNAIIWTRTSNIYEVFYQLRTFGYVNIATHENSINWALRLEILTNTTRGICSSVEAAEEDLRHGKLGNKRYRFTEVKEIYLNDDDVYLEVPTPDVSSVLHHRRTSRNSFDSMYDTFVAPARPISEVIFTDYAPQVFRYLRRRARITSEQYRMSFQRTTKERVSEGKSGAFLYFTEDKKYIVKTLTHEELKFLLLILPKYCAYIASSPHTLVTRYFGCHAITMYNKTVHFVVMQSVFDTRLQIHERFDLKGSWVGRLEGRKPRGTKANCKYCSKPFIISGSHNQICDARESGLRHVHDQIGKDLNWNRHMSLSNLTAENLASQLIKDSDFLQSINSIDYSLLVGIHYRSFVVAPTPGASVEQRLSAKQPFHRQVYNGMPVEIVRGPGIYYMGLIDILQPWNLRKRLERLIRVYLFMQDPLGISVINPNAYAKRFQQRVVKEIIYDPSPLNLDSSTNMTPIGEEESPQQLVRMLSSGNHTTFWPNNSSNNDIYIRKESCEERRSECKLRRKSRDQYSLYSEERGMHSTTSNSTIPVVPLSYEESRQRDRSSISVFSNAAAMA